VGGLWEDVTKSLSAQYRLVLSFVVAALAFWFLDVRLMRLDIPYFSILNSVVAFAPLSFLLTVLAVAGLTNAINIIDGFNGLASAVSLMYFLGLAYVAYKLGDSVLMPLCLAMAGGILGFFVLNWPRGLIFLGDGGAYLIGFMLAAVSLLLVHRHGAVSPWFPLLLILYPICETLFTIYRRVVLHGKPASIADGIHFHSLIYRRIVRWVAGHDEAKKIVLRNSMTSPYLWALSSLSVIPAVLFWNNTLFLMGFIILFVLSYVWLYWRIVRFRTPKLLRR
jgi:UDP-N-acetylmuramyl pentapeptide phosphotransferase/UDP-N-acetylglucosamine-1-phosphate transferase